MLASNFLQLCASLGSHSIKLFSTSLTGTVYIGLMYNILDFISYKQLGFMTLYHYAKTLSLYYNTLSLYFNTLSVSNDTLPLCIDTLS